MIKSIALGYAILHAHIDDITTGGDIDLGSTILSGHLVRAAMLFKNPTYRREIETYIVLIDPDNNGHGGRMVDWGYMDTGATQWALSYDVPAEVEGLWKIYAYVKGYPGGAILEETTLDAFTIVSGFCTPGETKCIGPDLYTCGSDSSWHLTQRDAPQCIVPNGDGIPWVWLLAGAAGVATLAFLLHKRGK